MLAHRRATGSTVQRRNTMAVYDPDPALSSQLTIPTYDGAGQPIHPGVVDLGAGNEVSGYRYWMAFTPYTFTSDKTENPSIVASTDGQTWVVPAGLTNPLSGPPTLGYYSDPDLLYDAGTFYCYYRYSVGSPLVTSYLLRTSTDGIAWSAESEFATATSGSAIVSPTIQKVGSEYVMWQRGVRRRSSSDPTWFGDTSTACTISGLSASVWHLSVVQYDGLFYMIANTVSTDGGGKIYVGASSNGVAFNFTGTPLISPGDGGTWDNERIYQGDAVIDDTNGVQVWYSARGSSGAWGIGYLEFALSVLPDPP